MYKKHDICRLQIFHRQELLYPLCSDDYLCWKKIILRSLQFNILCIIQRTRPDSPAEGKSSPGHASFIKIFAQVQSLGCGMVWCTSRVFSGQIMCGHFLEGPLNLETLQLETRLWNISSSIQKKLSEGSHRLQKISAS